MRKLVLVGALAVALVIPGGPALADDGAMNTTCPTLESGAEFGAHASMMAGEGSLGADMTPGMHQGYSHMAR